MKTEMINQFEDATAESSMHDQYSGSAVAAIIGWHVILLLMLAA